MKTLSVIAFRVAAVLMVIFCTQSQSFAGETAIKEDLYVIGRGDVLGVHVWKEDELSIDVIVRMDGRITLPLAGEVDAAGKTPPEVRTEIEKKLKEFIEAPVVTVSLKNATSQKFYVLGEVQKTGEYPLIKKLKVLQAFALAGGFTQWASKDEIVLLRTVDGKEQIIRINYKQIAKGKELDKNLQIMADDTIIVP